MAYTPWRCVGSLESTNAVVLDREAEAATQTFKTGVPVMRSSGYVAEFSTGAANIVLGVALQPGQNFASAGVGVEYSYATPPNQASAKTFPHGGWPLGLDGKCGFTIADGNNIFAGKLKAGQTFTVANLGVTYGIVKDGTTGYWYIDTTVTSGNGAVVQIVSQSSNQPNTSTDAEVNFQFIPSKRVYA